MLNRLSKPLTLEISADAVIASSGLVRQPISCATEAPTPDWIKAMLLAVGTILDRPKNPSVSGSIRGTRTVQIIIADELARVWLTTPPANASEPGDCVAAAALRFEWLFGLPSSAWKISADWDAYQPFLCAALPVAIVDGLTADFAAREVQLASITPKLIATWNGLGKDLQAGDWLAIVGERTVTLVRASGARWWSGLRADVVRVLARPAGAALDRAWVSAAIAREAMQRGLSSPQGITLLGQRVAP